MLPWKFKEFFMLAPRFLLGEDWNDRIKIQKVMRTWPHSHYLSVTMFMPLNLSAFLSLPLHTGHLRSQVEEGRQGSRPCCGNTELLLPLSTFADPKIHCALELPWNHSFFIHPVITFQNLLSWPNNVSLKRTATTSLCKNM